MTTTVIRLWLDPCPRFSRPNHSDSTHLARFESKIDSRLMSRAQSCPAVNGNGLSHQTVSLVKVKSVLKTTDCAQPLPVNNFYDTKHHCAPGIFPDCYPANIYQRRPSNLTPKRVTLPIMIIEPTCTVEGYFIRKQTQTQRKEHRTRQTIDCLQLARNVLFPSLFSILTGKEIIKKCCNCLRLQAGVGVDENLPAPTPTPQPCFWQ